MNINLTRDEALNIVAMINVMLDQFPGEATYKYVPIKGKLMREICIHDQKEMTNGLEKETRYCVDCYYEAFDARAYTCSMCIKGEERTDKFQPRKK